MRKLRMTIAVLTALTVGFGVYAHNTKPVAPNVYIRGEAEPIILDLALKGAAPGTPGAWDCEDQTDDPCYYLNYNSSTGQYSNPSAEMGDVFFY